MPKPPTPATSDAVELLQRALSQGCNVVLSLAAPPHVNRTPPLIASCRLRFGLTRAEAVILVQLLERGHVEREPLRAAMARDGSPAVTSKNLSVVASTLRRKMAAHGVVINTLWGAGFTLDEAARARVRKLLESATTPPAETTGALLD
jgi:hypothetical protein